MAKFKEEHASRIEKLEAWGEEKEKEYEEKIARLEGRISSMTVRDK